jgi:hypothetical protein
MKGVQMGFMRRDITLYTPILKESGHELNPESWVLNLGRVKGKLTHDYSRAGLQALGVVFILRNLYSR